MPGVCMTRSGGFIRREGARRRRRGRRETTTAATTTLGRRRRRRGPHPWRTPLTTTRYAAPLPTYRVIILIMPKPPRTTMTKRGAWWEYHSSGYVQWDTWRP